jgi:protein involved in polysaccharide export with SLBB domain
LKFLPLLFTLATFNASAQEFVCSTPPGNNVVIAGYVTNPGVYSLPAATNNALTLLAAIAQAGGFATGAGHVAYVTRRDSDGIAHLIPISLRSNKSVAGVSLQAGDILLITDRVGTRIRGCFRADAQ